MGLRLNSIKAGSEITIQEVNIKEKRLILETSQGKKRSRPIGELEKIWERLCINPAVHVDEVLHGSGSSRNQPETILANLPYIEWFRYNNKKHIAYVVQPTHHYGTLKQMDTIKADELKKSMRGDTTQDMPLILVITADIGTTCKTIEQITGIPVNPEIPGIYIHDSSNFRLMIVPHSIVPSSITPGTYPLIKSKSSVPGSIRFELGNMTLNAISESGMQLIIIDN